MKKAVFLSVAACSFLYSAEPMNKSLLKNRANYAEDNGGVYGNKMYIYKDAVETQREINEQIRHGSRNIEIASPTIDKNSKVRGVETLVEGGNLNIIGRNADVNIASPKIAPNSGVREINTAANLNNINLLSNTNNTVNIAAPTVSGNNPLTVINTNVNLGSLNTAANQNMTANIGSSTIDSTTSVKSLTTNVTVSGAVKVNSGSTVNVGAVNVGRQNNSSQNNMNSTKQNGSISGDLTYPSGGTLPSNNTSNIVMLNTNQTSGVPLQNCVNQMGNRDNTLTGQGSTMPMCNPIVYKVDTGANSMPVASNNYENLVIFNTDRVAYTVETVESPTLYMIASSALDFKSQYYEGLKQNYIIGLPKSIGEAMANGCNLLSPGKSIYHTQGFGNEYNLKFVCNSGVEAVFDIYGKPVDDYLNRGTYNQNVPGTWQQDGLHFVNDIVPYYPFGTGKDDKTTIYDRAIIYPDYLLHNALKFDKFDISDLYGDEAIKRREEIAIEEEKIYKLKKEYKNTTEVQKKINILTKLNESKKKKGQAIEYLKDKSDQYRAIREEMRKQPIEINDLWSGVF